MQTSDCRILWRTAAKKIQAFLQGSGIAPDGFRLFRAGTDQGLGHGPGPVSYTHLTLPTIA